MHPRRLARLIGGCRTAGRHAATRSLAPVAAAVQGRQLAERSSSTRRAEEDERALSMQPAEHGLQRGRDCSAGVRRRH